MADITAFPIPVQVFDPSIMETATTGVLRQTAQANQILRERMARFSGGPLEKLANAVAAGRVGRVLVAGTSISNAGHGTVQKFKRSLEREFGTAVGTSECMGILGGSVTGSYQNWARQEYAGPKFLRLRGTASSNTFTSTFMGDVFRLYYSKETDGGSFALTIDGTAYTIDCSGAQSFRNVFEVSLSPGPHRATYAAPATGAAYLEWQETFYASKGGVLVRDATLGGSALRNAAEGGTVVGDNGINAFLQAELDLAVIEWHVNDAGASGSWVSSGRYYTALEKLVTGYVALGIPVILLTELSGHYRMPSSSSAGAYVTAKKAIQRMARVGVWVIDWDAAHRTDEYVSDIDHFARSFYEASYDTGTGTSTGDFIHPTTIGYRSLDKMIGDLTGIRVRSDSNSSREALEALTYLPPEQSLMARVSAWCSEEPHPEGRRREGRP